MFHNPNQPPTFSGSVRCTGKGIPFRRTLVLSPWCRPFFPVVTWTHHRALCNICGFKIGWKMARNNMTLGIQLYSQMMIRVSNHLLSNVFRFHYHSQEVIGSLGWVKPLCSGKMTCWSVHRWIGILQFSSPLLGWDSPVFLSQHHDMNKGCISIPHPVGSMGLAYVPAFGGFFYGKWW